MKKKKVIIPIIGGIVILSAFLIIYFNNKNPVLKEENTKSELFSYMIETSAGSGDYEMATDNKWPGEGYIFNESLSRCENGSKLTWNDETKSVTLKANISDKCYLYFDKEPPDVTLATNNTDNTFNPTTPATLNCAGSNSVYNQKYQRIEVASIENKYTTCNLTYQTPSSKNYLNTYITSLAGQTQGDGQVVNEKATIDNSIFTPDVIFENSNYSNLANDTSYPFTWNAAEKNWTSTNKNNSTTSTITFSPQQSGNFQVCYTVSSEANYDKVTFYVDNSQIAQDSGNKSDCVYLGNLSSSNIIKVTYSKDGSSSSGNDNVMFYMQSGSYNEDIKTLDAGIRYEGKNPNNYIWFNNELWRIIGVFDEESHGQSGQNLVKIIRNDSIGGLAWDKSFINDWTQASLMNLLNGAYLNSENGTGGEYCYGFSTAVGAQCNYTENGINDAYRPMIENVTWYLGGYSDEYATADNFYDYERGDTVYSSKPTSTTGYIGLMYPSDYGYSVLASSCARTTELGDYDSSTCAGQSWLYGQGYEWTITPVSSSSAVVFYVFHYGNLRSNGNALDGRSARPVLYLNSNVYVIDGNGSISDPYIIGM